MMDTETLDRMIDAFIDKARSEDLDYDEAPEAFTASEWNLLRKAMSAALRAMWRPVKEVPMDCLPCIVTDAELDCDMIGYRTKGEWFDLYDDEPIEPTHCAPLLPTPEGELSNG